MNPEPLIFQFYCLFLPFAIPAIMGVEQSGYSSYLWGWVIIAKAWEDAGRQIDHTENL